MLTKGKDLKLKKVRRGVLRDVRNEVLREVIRRVVLLEIFWQSEVFKYYRFQNIGATHAVVFCDFLQYFL